MLLTSFKKMKKSIPLNILVYRGETITSMAAKTNLHQIFWTL